MNVIGFQKSANQITLHGGFNGQSVTVKGDYASYTVGGESYTINTKAEADSRRRLDDHHAREGGERMFRRNIKRDRTRKGVAQLWELALLVLHLFKIEFANETR